MIERECTVKLLEHQIIRIEEQIFIQEKTLLITGSQKVTCQTRANKLVINIKVFLQN